ncbi:MAG: oxygen-dependent coproporphyrinogen oxidase [Ekhidna sp.]|nr:oxygen-dependent coproporphyrinogen oxidase [Ekhidna sp.]
MKETTQEKIKDWFQYLQDTVCADLEKLDGKSTFQEDLWQREEGGGGRSRVIKSGDLIEKGGVNFSAVFGRTPKKILSALKLDKADFFASGVSIVLHPSNPWVPIIHMNIRYFEMSNGIWWFGGGIDLTPHFIIKEKAREFHQAIKETCDKHSPSYYSEFKKWADEYFFIKHRNETRGIGGIFFDRISAEEGFTKQQRWEFVREVGEAFLPIYTRAISDVREREWTDDQKEWQKIRRGRYVEFNLVYDKGTQFGLDTKGRTESILMSLPPEVCWEYDHQPKTDTQKETLSLLKKNINWIRIV